MNRYQAMMETLRIPAGQAERMKAAALAAEPERRRFRPWSVGKKVLLAALLAVGILITAGTALEVMAWDPAFLERFGTSSQEVPGAEGVFRDVNAAAVCGGGKIVVTVRDYGPGIPEAELPFVKQKFYKGSSKARGSGIGLAVCEEIIRLHEGTFEIGNAEGGGCIVTITLPAE